MEKTLTQKETEYRILQEEVKLNISGITLSPSQKEQELQKLKNSLATSELEYERDSSNFDLNSLKKKNEYLAKIEKEYISIDESIRSLNKTFNSLDLLLRIMPDKNYDNNYLTYYSAKNDSYRNNSITSLQKSYTLYKKLDEQLKEVKDRTNMQKLIELIDIELDLFQNLSSAGEQIMK
ncbi:MAG: hypothetical protein LBC61_00210 [Candidatus Peribacteria bacterium]|jgi:hypothetical protein|nr:hypothetical protein [Candidatus Peribacteria bacterium]